MHRIYPITDEACKPFWGRPVMVVMNDGTRHIGILSGIEKNQLVLNDDYDRHNSSFAKEHKTEKSGRRAKLSAKNNGKNKKKQTAGEAVVSAYGPGPELAGPYGPEGNWQGYGSRPFPYFGERLALDLAAVSLLFLIFI